MSAQYDYSHVEFDWDAYLQSSNKSEVEAPGEVALLQTHGEPDLNERCRQAVLLFKKKTKATNDVINKYYGNVHVREQLEELLNTAKEELKQSCIDNKNLTEKCTSLEKETIQLRISNANLQERCNRSENLYDATQSHVNQLQILAQENDKTIVSLKEENQRLQQNETSTAKAFEKKLSALKKENGELKKTLSLSRDIVRGKKKLTERRKVALQNCYKSYTSDDDGDSVFGDDSCDDINKMVAERLAEVKIKGRHASSKEENEHYSDFSHEIASADTGCGTSLASSDGEKCFNSPEYFINHSPINAHNYKEKQNYVDSCTSPIRINKPVDMATSPLPTYENIKMYLSPVLSEYNNEASNPIESELEQFTNNDEPNKMVESIFEPQDDSEIKVLIVEKTPNKSSSTKNVSSPSNSLPKITALNSIVSAENTISISSKRSLIFDDNNIFDARLSGGGEQECLEMNNVADNPIESECDLFTNNDDLNEMEVSILESEDDSEINQLFVEKAPNKSSTTKNVSSPSNLLPKQIALDSTVSAKNTCCILSRSPLIFDDNDLDACPSNGGEKECLEINNSNNYDKTNTEDCEIEMILNNMRFDRTLITPIPSTPKSKTSPLNGVSCKDADKILSHCNLLFEKQNEKFKNIEEKQCSFNEKIKKMEEKQSSLIDSDMIKAIYEYIKNKQFAQGGTVNKVVENPPITTQFKQPPLPAVKRSTEPFKKTVHSSPSTSTQVISHKVSLPPPINKSVLDVLDIESIGTVCHENSKSVVENEEIAMDSRSGDEVISQINVNREQEQIPHAKHRKLTKLEKLRKNLVPKSKIKKYTPSNSRKLLIKPQKLPLYKTKAMPRETAATLNNKRAYEKALKVMNELKSKQKSSEKVELIIRNETEMNAIEKHDMSDNFTNIDQSGSGSPKRENKDETNVNHNKNNKQSLNILTNNVSTNAEKTNQMSNSELNIMKKKDPIVVLEKIDQNIKFAEMLSPKKTKTTSSHKNHVGEICVQEDVFESENGDQIPVQKKDSAKQTKEIQKQGTDESVVVVVVNEHEMLHENVDEVNILNDVVQNSLLEENSATANDNNESQQVIWKLRTRRSAESQEMLGKHVEEFALPKDFFENRDVKRNSIRKKNSANKTSETLQDTEKRISVESPEMSGKYVEEVTIPKDISEGKDVERNSIRKENSATANKTNEIPQDTEKLLIRESVESYELPRKNIKEGNVRENDDQNDDQVSATENITYEIQEGTRRGQKRSSIDSLNIPRKRVLRSSALRQSRSDDNTSINSDTEFNSDMSMNVETIMEDNNISTGNPSHPTPNAVNYGDLDLFSNEDDAPPKKKRIVETNSNHPKDSIFCAMIEKYGKQSTKNFSKKVPEPVTASTCKIIQQEINTITAAPSEESKNAMNKFVDIIKSWESKIFLAGLMAYLKDPERKNELFNKINCPPAPAMTKSEQVLLYVISQLSYCWSTDIVNSILLNIAYVLFKLNKTPDFEVIESMSHFYAILCRYFKLKSRLRQFMLDAMYCIQFKAVPLIKQCLEVWMHVLPLAHMGIAKSPIVTCMVYLLHFYKCEDKYNRVQEIRHILNRKYFYEITEWNEPKIMEMLRSAIKDIRAVPMEEKLLKIALIVIAKRHGARWCQQKIIKKLMLPMIEKDVPDRVKNFCISMLGPLLKPYPVDMKVHCEIILNQLLDMLKENPSHARQEAIITSLIHMSKHSPTRVLQTLVTWKPQGISPQLEELFRDYVTDKPLRVWKAQLSKLKLENQRC